MGGGDEGVGREGAEEVEGGGLSGHVTSGAPGYVREERNGVGEDCVVGEGVVRQDHVQEERVSHVRLMNMSGRVGSVDASHESARTRTRSVTPLLESVVGVVAVVGEGAVGVKGVVGEGVVGVRGVAGEGVVELGGVAGVAGEDAVGVEIVAGEEVLGVGEGVVGVQDVAGEDSVEVGNVAGERVCVAGDVAEEGCVVGGRMGEDDVGVGGVAGVSCHDVRGGALQRAAKLQHCGSSVAVQHGNTLQHCNTGVSSNDVRRGAPVGAPHCNIPQHGCNTPTTTPRPTATDTLNLPGDLGVSPAREARSKIAATSPSISRACLTISAQGPNISAQGPRMSAQEAYISKGTSPVSVIPHI